MCSGLLICNHESKKERENKLRFEAFAMNIMKVCPYFVSVRSLSNSAPLPHSDPP
jgi:hypothetical protein